MPNSIIIEDLDEHAKVYAALMIVIQLTIKDLNPQNPKKLAEVISSIMHNMGDIQLLKYRELFTFLIEKKLIKEQVLISALEDFVEYQRTLANKAIIEVNNMLDNMETTSFITKDPNKPDIIH